MLSHKLNGHKRIYLKTLVIYSVIDVALHPYSSKNKRRWKRRRNTGEEGNVEVEKHAVWWSSVFLVKEKQSFPERAEALGSGKGGPSDRAVLREGSNEDLKMKEDSLIRKTNTNQRATCLFCLTA